MTENETSGRKPQKTLDDTLEPEAEDILDKRPRDETDEVDAPLVKKARIGQFMDNFIPEDVWSPKGGRTIAIVGEKEQGKSNLTYVLAKYTGMVFSEIWVVTQSTDGELAGLVNRPCMVLNNVTEAYFEKMIRRQQEQPKKIRKSVLIIFDDFIGTDFDFQYSKSMKQIASRNRHLRISTIFSTQKFKEMPDIFRKNAQWWFFGKNVLSSMKQITEELATVQLEPKRMRSLLYRIAADESFEFLGLKNCRPSGFVHFRPPHLKPDTDDEGSDSDSEGEEEGEDGEGGAAPTQGDREVTANRERG